MKTYELIEYIRELEKIKSTCKNQDSREYKILKQRIDAYLIKENGEKSIIYREFKRISTGTSAGFIDNSGTYIPIENDSKHHIRFIEGIDKKIKYLNDLINLNNKIFIVHGRDDEFTNEVCEFLKQNGYNPIAIKDEPSLGDTIIEKIKDYSDISCAVVLMTPDDIGRYKNDNPEKNEPRARQNVIFEYGYFEGLLGKERVILINDVPNTYSDIKGKSYYKKENYKDIIKELDKIGINKIKE